MRAIIMAGGDGTRWKNHTGRPKHVVDVEGEPLLDRTHRQLSERSVDDVVTLGPYDHPTCVLPTYTKIDTDKFRSTIEHWGDDQVAILYGDVWFSDAAIDALLTPVDDFAWVGREGASKITKCPWGELFGVTIAPPAQDHLRESIERVASLLTARKIGRGGGWEVYKASVGLPLDKHVVTTNFIEINDWSDDFDFPGDYDRWVTQRAAAGFGLKDVV